jgi:hypothetical protein
MIDKYQSCKEKKESIMTKNEKIAQKVIDTYPSLNELCKHDMMDKILLGWDQNLIENKVLVLSTAVDNMCNTMYDLGFYKSTWFNAVADPFDENTGKNIDGEALIYDARSDTHKVNYLEFIALSKVMFCSFLRIELNDKQCEALSDFKAIPKIYRILD